MECGALQPFAPGKTNAKFLEDGIDLGDGVLPGALAGGVCDQWIQRCPSRFEGHRHAVAREWRDHGMRVSNLALAIGSGCTKAQAGDCNG